LVRLISIHNIEYNISS